ncbi:MAG TPA: response regulator [Burkholderiales bacterium]|nr:response regulator [Burkholderiales bacterium]
MDDKTAYALTRKGTAELNSAQTSLSALELKLLVLIDGKATLGRILKTFSSPPQAELLDTLAQMKRAGLIADRGKDDGGGDHGGIEASGFLSRPVFPAAGTAEADAAAQSDQTLELLRRNGYVVRIAKRAVEERKLAKGEKITVLVIEDDAQLAKLVRMFLTLHELVPRMAANKDEIVAALRLAPKPDVVLLDVVLPDIDGFDVLLRLKQHPVLKAVPVIMMTAKATREAVLKGLARGADGYLTKPFDVDVISQAVKSVLGIR